MSERDFEKMLPRNGNRIHLKAPLDGGKWNRTPQSPTQNGLLGYGRGRAFELARRAGELSRSNVAVTVARWDFAIRDWAASPTQRPLYGQRFSG